MVGIQFDKGNQVVEVISLHLVSMLLVQQLSSILWFDQLSFTFNFHIKIEASNLYEYSVYASCDSIAFWLMVFSCLVCWSRMLLMTFVCFNVNFLWYRIKCFLILKYFELFMLLMDDLHNLILQLCSLDSLLWIALQQVFRVTYAFWI